MCVCLKLSKNSNYYIDYYKERFGMGRKKNLYFLFLFLFFFLSFYLELLIEVHSRKYCV